MTLPAATGGQLALPRTAHRPGSGSRPDLPPLIAAKTLCPPRIDPADWARNGAYLYGFRLYNEGFFWEAHEVWETVWLACRPNASERSLMVALIQLTNATLKLAMGRQAAALRILPAAAEALRECESRRSIVMGVHISRLLAELARFGARVEAEAVETWAPGMKEAALLELRPRLSLEAAGPPER